MNNTLLSITIALLFGIGTYLILRRDLIRIIIGFSILSHAVNMLIVSVGAFDAPEPPIIVGEAAPKTVAIFNDSLAQSTLAPIVAHSEAQYVDPLVQALVLTAIVISLAITAFMLVLAYRIYEETGTMDIHFLRRLRG
jgi:multicomponent Na+:H+ antiporter subunit C